MTRREEKKLCAALASAADALSKPGLNYAELYFGRVVLAQAIRALVSPGEGVLDRTRPAFVRDWDAQRKFDPAASVAAGSGEE